MKNQQLVALILFILTILISTTDPCTQQTTYSQCIGIPNQQCLWNNNYCSFSNNYLLGCDPNLSETLCKKQFGYLNGTLAMCIFNDYCHWIESSDSIKCSDSLSKSACLSSTQELCKWYNGECQSLNNTELNTLNTIYPSLELSASVCSRITNYLIIHSFLLWDLMDYSYDIITEASNLVKTEAGVDNDEDTISYDESETLQDNYYDSDSSTYIWYTTSTSLSISSTKWNDYTRYGCIAQEILTESRYSMLFTIDEFIDEGSVLTGINHVYCSYLSQQYKYSAFIEYQCIRVGITTLQNNPENINIFCESLDSSACQLQLSTQYKCQIQTTQEYQCQTISIITIQTQCNSQTNIATHYSCAQVTSELCYLEDGSCSQICNQQTQTLCESESNCIWLGDNLGDATTSSDFLLCVPSDICDQLGLNIIYCQQIASNCYWDNENTKCNTITNIKNWKCADCNTIYCCTSITFQDQFCIWNTNKCINILDQPLFSHYVSFPVNTIMNINLCVYQQGQFKYNLQTRKCELYTTQTYCIPDDTESISNCSNLLNVSKDYCLTLIFSNTKWNLFTQMCMYIPIGTYDCDELTLVNQNVCRYGTPTNQLYCLYNSNTQSCYSSSEDLTCETLGITKEQCLSINSYCQWENNQCNLFDLKTITLLNCIELQNISSYVCTYANNNSGQCIYDQGNCRIGYSNQSSCNGYWNQYTCQYSSSQCYFDTIQQRCLDSTDYLSLLSCDTDYISETTCISITTSGQNCFWGTIISDSTIKCRTYKSDFQSSCTQYTGNVNLCSALTSNIYIDLSSNQFCEIVNDECITQSDTISDDDCGYSSRIMNVYRCMQYTTNQCYFQNQKCTLLQGPTKYQQIMLQYLTCDQSNFTLCVLIQTQACMIQTNKCISIYTLNTYTCSNLSSFDMTVYGVQICSRASDQCYYNGSQCQIPQSTDSFDCNQIGLSELTCITKTKGICAYSNYLCSIMTDLTIECEYRNKQACLIGGLNCIWSETNSVCSLSTTLCPTSYSDVQAFPVCGLSSSACFPGLSGCVADSTNYLPCWFGLSYQVCLNQNKYCQWIDSQCKTIVNHTCEDAQTLQECILHPTLQCVYNNNSCFEINDITSYQCNQFSYTSAIFCRSYYPLCSFNSSTYQCTKLYYLSNSNQIDTTATTTYGCQALSASVYSCVLQRQFKCIYYNVQYYYTCYPNSSNNAQCPYFDQSYPISILSCQNVSSCKFGLTLDGMPFCYTDPLTCEQLNETFCLSDIPNINCYWDPNYESCFTNTLYTDCEDTLDIYTNRQMCITLSETNECYYDPTNLQCKKLSVFDTSLSCSDLTDLYSCSFYPLNCKNIYSSGSFDSCDDVSSYDKDMNYFSCINLLDAAYYYKLNNYTCQPYTNSITINTCKQLNKISCLINESNSCVWIDDQCKQYSTNFISLDCSLRNYQTCIESKRISCLWDTTNTICTSTYINPSIPSEAYCINQSQLWDGTSCYTYTSNLPNSFHQCENLGLSMDLCLNNTINLKCFWDGYICINANLDILQCSGNLSQQSCLSLTSQPCYYDTSCQELDLSSDCDKFLTLQYCKMSTNTCKFNISCTQIDTEQQFCYDTLSYGACQNVINSYCMWDNGQCTNWYRGRFSCEYIINKWGCLYSMMYCQWIDNQCQNIEEDEQYLCLQLPQGYNSASCSSYSSEPCLFNTESEQCDIQLTYAFTTSLQTDQSPHTQIKLIENCKNISTKSDCIGSRIYACEWLNSTCIESISNSCLNQSLLGCMQQSLLCAWRDQQCIIWDINETDNLSLLTSNCCNQLNLLVKYDSTLMSCLDLQLTDDCEGLSEYSCLNHQGKQCIYKNENCQTYIYEYHSLCSDYINITFLVCQNLPILNCKYDSDNNQCIDTISTDQCTTIGLSKYGCTTITTEACYWNNNSCNQFQVIDDINQCDNLTIFNSLSCSLMNYHKIICSYNYNTRTCQQRININSICETPGLNKWSCLSLTREPCQYINNICTKIYPQDSTCVDLLNVNELACRMNTASSCGYDSIDGKCFYTLQNYPCDYSGINVNVCLISQSSCSWSYDDFQCKCSLLNSSTSKCNQNQNHCSENTLCIWDNSYCRLKECDDLTQDNCIGTVNNKKCYLNGYGICQGSQKCEDIISLSNNLNCESFIFDGSTCIQIQDYCVSATNLSEICPNSDCTSSSCIYNNYVCSPLECQNYNTTECLQYNGCAIIDDQCNSLYSCAFITNQSTCISITKMQCSWELYGIYDNTYHCTNTQCNVYSVSSTICNGNEINGHSCFMDQFFKCKTCEQITDKCTCTNSQGACKYSGGSCKSILCSSFIQQSICEASNKCYWSTVDQVCRKVCTQIILQEECEALDYECHWNQYQYNCQQGVATTPDLSVTINVQDIFSLQLTLVLVWIIM